MRRMTCYAMAGLLCVAALAGCPCPPSGDFTLTPVPGELAFDIEGPFGFAGTLENPPTDDLRWELRGRFAFPHPGFLVASKAEVMESFPEQVRITLIVTVPPPGAYPAVIDEVPVALTINVSDGARFEIVYEERCIPG